MLSKSLFLRWSVDNLDRLIAGGIRGKYTSTQCTSPKLSYDLVHEHRGLNGQGWKSCKKLSASVRDIHNTDNANTTNTYPVFTTVCNQIIYGTTDFSILSYIILYSWICNTLIYYIWNIRFGRFIHAYVTNVLVSGRISSKYDFKNR